MLGKIDIERSAGEERGAEGGEELKRLKHRSRLPWGLTRSLEHVTGETLRVGQCSPEIFVTKFERSDSLGCGSSPRADSSSRLGSPRRTGRQSQDRRECLIPQSGPGW